MRAAARKNGALFNSRNRCRCCREYQQLPFRDDGSIASLFLEYRSPTDNRACVTIARQRPRSYSENILKKDEQDSAQPDFWSQRYASGKAPWKLDRVPARVTTFIRSLPSRSKVLIPGCGQDHRTVEAFHLAGHQGTAIDFSPVAVEYTRRVLPDLQERIILGDFFSYDFGDAPFDIVYERTFLCSLPPRRWKSYTDRVAQLLRPHGRLVGFFFYGKESDPPPYPLTESKAAEILGVRFDLLNTEPVTDSLSIFGGNEKWQEWERR